MFNTILEKFGGVFSRSYILSCWFPSFSAAVVMLFVYYYPSGYAGIISKWGAWDNPRHIIVLVALFLAITLLAYLLHGISYYLMRLYEGYWPPWLQEIILKRVTRKWKHLCKMRSDEAPKESNSYYGLQARIYFGYPAEGKYFLPTRFGNIIRSAELYPQTSYGLDGAFWWPRLFPLIPEVIQDNLNEQLVSMMTLIHLSCLSFLAGLFSIFHFLSPGFFHFGQPTSREWIAMGIFAALMIFSWLAYLGTLAKANSYGLLIRSSYDRHRFQLLAALGFTLPRNPVEERKIWSNLENWLYNYNRQAAAKLKFKITEKKE